MKSRRSIASVVVAVSLAAGVAGGALASPNKQQYGNPGAKEPTTSAVIGAKSPPVRPPIVKSGGTLPFTGQNIALIVGVGGIFVAAGLGFRRAGRHDR